MELIRLEYDKETTICPNCGKDTDCPECSSKMDYCIHCGETLEKHDVFIVFTTENYHGEDNASNYTATLIIDGKDYAQVHIEESESDAGGDVAYLQLSYIPEEKQTDEISIIVGKFAKWIKFDWRNPDMQSELPVLVRLLGFTIDKRVWPWSCEKWIALQNALEIKTEHLAWRFTSKEIE